MHAYIHLHKRIITNMLQASIQLQELQARMDKEEKYKADVQVCVCTFPWSKQWNAVQLPSVQEKHLRSLCSYL